MASFRFWLVGGPAANDETAAFIGCAKLSAGGELEPCAPGALSADAVAQLEKRSAAAAGAGAASAVQPSSHIPAYLNKRAFVAFDRPLHERIKESKAQKLAESKEEAS